MILDKQECEKLIDFYIKRYRNSSEFIKTFKVFELDILFLIHKEIQLLREGKVNETLFKERILEINEKY